jgi:hypothetical protein
VGGTTLERSLMGRPWDADLPIATVPQVSSPKRVTLILPYYENPTFFMQQLSGWMKFRDDVLDHLSVIVVDDGSPKQSLNSLMHGVRPPCPFRAFRIDVDVRWNWLAARNIGAFYAEDGWMVLTDMDHVLPYDTYGAHDPNRIYAFSRVEHTGERLAAHPNSWFITRKMFWRVGGYDESLSGHYGTDGEWRRRMAARAQIHVLPQHLERHEYVGDSSTTRYQRKQPIDAAVKQLIAARGKNWTPKTLSFPYHELVLQVDPCRVH